MPATAPCWFARRQKMPNTSAGNSAEAASENAAPTTDAHIHLCHRNGRSDWSVPLPEVLGIGPHLPYQLDRGIEGALDHVLTARALSPEQREQVIEDSMCGVREARLAWPMTISQEDITDAARRIDVPVLVLSGDEDKVDATATLSPLQRAFLETGGAQCGICTPGMLMAAQAYLDGGGDADEDHIREAIAGNLCRCTGYTKIIEAIEMAALGR